MGLLRASTCGAARASSTGMPPSCRCKAGHEHALLCASPQPGKNTPWLPQCRCSATAEAAPVTYLLECMEGAKLESSPWPHGLQPQNGAPCSFLHGCPHAGVNLLRLESQPGLPGESAPWRLLQCWAIPQELPLGLPCGGSLQLLHSSWTAGEYPDHPKPSEHQLLLPCCATPQEQSQCMPEVASLHYQGAAEGHQQQAPLSNPGNSRPAQSFCVPAEAWEGLSLQTAGKSGCVCMPIAGEEIVAGVLPAGALACGWPVYCTWPYLP